MKETEKAPNKTTKEQFAFWAGSIDRAFVDLEPALNCLRESEEWPEVYRHDPEYFKERLDDLLCLITNFHDAIEEQRVKVEGGKPLPVHQNLKYWLGQMIHYGEQPEATHAAKAHEQPAESAIEGK